MKISWTPKARQSYFEIIEHLGNAWTEREIQNFIILVDHLLEQIRLCPEMFEESRKKKNVRKGIITKQNTLYYRVRNRKKEIQLIVFWDNRQDPGKMPY